MEAHQFHSEFAHITEIQVRWGDMDVLGHINNALYFRYFEIARIKYFEALDYGVPLIGQNSGPILAQIECQFRIPIEYPDHILIGSSIHHIGTTSARMRHRVFSSARKKVVAEADSVIVNFDYVQQMKVPIPDEVRKQIEAFERSVSG